MADRGGAGSRSKPMASSLEKVAAFIHKEVVRETHGRLTMVGQEQP